MSINLFKKFRSPNTVKHIYFYLYREINKQVAKKQYEIMQHETDKAINLYCEKWDLYSNGRIRCLVKAKVKERSKVFFRAMKLNHLQKYQKHIKDGYHMFKCMKIEKYIKYKIKPSRWKESYACLTNMKFYHKNTLYRILQENKYKGRSKLKTKKKMIQAIMKM